MIEEWYNNGIKAWNRNQTEIAIACFDKVLNSIHILDEYSKLKVADFYKSISQKDNVLTIYRDMIYKGQSLSVILKDYVAISGEKIELEDMYYIEKIKVASLDNDVMYHIAKAYFKYHNNLLKGYEIIANVLDRIEYSKLESGDVNTYIDSVLMIVEMEYIMENFAQSRLQIKKLICNDKLLDRKQIDEVIYWSVVLNVFDGVLRNKEWSQYLNKIEDKNLKIISYVFLNMYRGSVDMKLFRLLSSIDVADDRLTYRIKVMLIYLKKCMGDLTWEQDLDLIDIKKCYLSSILYFEKNKDSSAFDTEKYWDAVYGYHSDIHQIVNSKWSEGYEKKEKKLDDVKIQFIGGADKIGGSCVVVKYNGKVIMLDAGANINEKKYHPDYSKLNSINSDITDINYLIVSHGHLDHIGSIPYIYKNSKNVNIISTIETKNIMKVMLEDTVKISNDSESKIMFDSNDVKNMISSVNIHEFDQRVQLCEGVYMTLYKAGHILGAACVYLELGDTKVLYTGDYCMVDQHTVVGLGVPNDLEVDILITESTYAYHPTNFDLRRDLQEKMLLTEIERATKNNGVVLIPAFAVGRAQEIVMAIKKFYKNEFFMPFDLYLDGKVVEVCSIYEKSINVNSDIGIYGNGVSLVSDRYRGKNGISINKFKGSCIIASSGMLNENSRSSKYASSMLEDENNVILFSGYLDEESPGRGLLNEVKNKVVPVFKIENEIKEVRCIAKTYKLSAHAKKSEIIDLITKVKPRYTFLVHGEVNNKYKYFGDETDGAKIYSEIEDVLEYIEDVKIIKPVNGQVFKVDQID